MDENKVISTVTDEVTENVVPIAEHVIENSKGGKAIAIVAGVSVLLISGAIFAIKKYATPLAMRLSNKHFNKDNDAEVINVDAYGDNTDDINTVPYEE